MRTRLTSGLVVMCALATAVITAPPAQANGNCVTYWAARGSGTLANPYPVATQLDLQEIDYCPDKVFSQTADITLSGTWTPLGRLTSAFTGTYSGNGFHISELLTTTEDAVYVGLFGSIGSGAVITDTHVTGSIIGGRYVGGLVGRAIGATVLDSSASVTVTESSSLFTGREFIGGLIGHATDTTISGSRTGGSISLPFSSPDYLSIGGLVGLAQGCAISASSASGNVDGGINVGGLVGTLGGGSLGTSFATGAVSGISSVGGLVGYALADGPSPNSITDVYARGNVVSTGGNAGAVIGYFQGSHGSRSSAYATGPTAGATPLGGFVGLVGGSMDWTAGFWDVQTTGQSTASGSGTTTGLTGQSSVAMTNIATYQAAGWNIGGWAASGTTWGICPGVNDGYPYLQAFYASNPCDDGPTPPPWPQGYARASGDTCLPGWNPSWAEWPNGNTGGFVCQRTLVYNRSTGQWDPRRLMRHLAA